MRLSVLALLASALALARAGSLDEFDTDESAPKSTTFNSQTVPPLLDLTPQNWKDEVNKTKWLMVKFYRYTDMMR